MTPEAFADFIAKHVAPAVAQMIKESPPKPVQVHRVDPNGVQYQQTTTMPQIMAELTDIIKVSVGKQEELLEEISDLTKAFKKAAKGGL